MGNKKKKGFFDEKWDNRTIAGMLSEAKKEYYRNPGNKQLKDLVEKGTDYLSIKDKTKKEQRNKELKKLLGGRFKGLDSYMSGGSDDSDDWDLVKKDPLVRYEVPDLNRNKPGIITNSDGSLNMAKVMAAISVGAVTAKTIHELVKKYKNNTNDKQKQLLEAAKEAKAIAALRNPEAANTNYSEDNMEDIILGNNGVAIVGNGAVDALASTIGEYAEYAEVEGVLELGVDSLRAAQLAKLENAEQFAESDEIAIDDCIYSVGDEVEVCEGISGRVIEVLPLPATFSDSTVTSQIMLDNGVLANVTDQGTLWVEMSENGEIVTTPLVKYNSLTVDGEEFSMVDLGFIDPDYAELNNFSVEDYIAGDYETTDFSEEVNEPVAEPTQDIVFSETTTNEPAAEPTQDIVFSEAQYGSDLDEVASWVGNLNI